MMAKPTQQTFAFIDSKIQKKPRAPRHVISFESHAPARGRGTGLSVDNRYDAWQRRSFQEEAVLAEEDVDTVVTKCLTDATRTIITRNNSPDLPFSQSINPYRGCEHGCPYCYARPSHAWLGLSPGADFETTLVCKPNAAELLRKALCKLGRPQKVEPIAMGTNTDPWQPMERRLRITRSLLEVFLEFSHPLTVISKGAALIDDIPLLTQMAKRNLIQVRISIPTLDGGLARKLEPRAATPAKRLDIIRQLSDACVPVGVMVAPIIPGLTDHEIESILQAARNAGARSANYTLLRLPGEVEAIFLDWLNHHVPNRASRVLSLLRQCRQGKLYDSRFRHRMKGEGVLPRLYVARFASATRRLSLDQPLPPLNCEAFSLPLPVERGKENLFASISS